MKTMKIHDNRIVKKIALFLTSLYIASSNFFMSFASEADLENTKLITGTKSLLSVATGILTGLILAVTIFVSVKNGLTWQSADINEKPAAKKRFITEIGIGILGITIGSVITAIFAFYQ